MKVYVYVFCICLQTVIVQCVLVCVHQCSSLSQCVGVSAHVRVSFNVLCDCVKGEKKSPSVSCTSISRVMLSASQDFFRDIIP